MSNKKKKKKSQPIGLYIAVIAFFVVLALLEAFIKKSHSNSYTYNQTKTLEKETDATSTSEDIQLYNGLEIPICGATHNENDHEIRYFHNYALCYRESYEQAEWSAYCLNANQLTKNTERSNDFRADNSISTGSASLADYKGSGYDRGHLTPAADMAFNNQAMSETFFMSNMSPQHPQFNRGIWMHLEAQVRDWTKQFGKVYVITGPILEKDSSSYKSIGVNNVAVPDFYYKVILVPLYQNKEDYETPDTSKAVMAIGFIIPNKGTEKPYWDYAVTIDEVEKRTGLDFFSLLEDDIEDSVEASFVIDNWK